MKLFDGLQSYDEQKNVIEKNVKYLKNKEKKMTEYDYWKIFPRMPKKVTIGDITVRDGFQHEEKFVSTEAKKFYLEELIFAGCRNIEVTNLGNPNSMPQFRDAENLLSHLKGDRF